MSRLTGFWLLLVVSVAARADDFERLEGKTLAEVAASPALETRARLTYADIGSLPRVLEAVRSTLILVKTEDGNLAPVLVDAALRKAKTLGETPRPVVVLARYATFEGPTASNRMAAGGNVVLFDGFEFDLDTGQVVPAGQGGDLAFRAGGDEVGPGLEPVGSARMWSFTRPPLDAVPAAAGTLSPGRQVVPGDFSGRYRVEANGQWSGLLELVVGERNVVTGRFRSDETGNAYAVTGQAAFEEPHRVLFAVELPRSRLEFDGRLWTEGKGALAGTVNLLGRDYGFYAVRETPRVGLEPE